MIQLNLNRPLAFIDLETTGTNIAKDRIVQIAIIKIHSDNTKKTYEQFINPTIPIPNIVSKIHGIYDKDVQDKPTFNEVAKSIVSFLDNCDLAGYNSNKFDVPILVEEFLRVGINFEMKDRKLVDVQNIFHLLERRTLKAAYKFYTGKILKDAHNAMVDIEATYQVLLKQIERYEGKKYNSEEEHQLTPVKNDINSLHNLSYTTNKVDFAGRIVYDKNNVETFNFGKHKGKTVKQVLQEEPSYYYWMMKGDFPLYTKKVLSEIKEKMGKDDNG